MQDTRKSIATVQGEMDAAQVDLDALYEKRTNWAVDLAAARWRWTNCGTNCRLAGRN